MLFVEIDRYERRQRSEEVPRLESRLRRMVDDFHQKVISRFQTFFELSRIIMKEDHAVSHRRLGAIFYTFHIFDKAQQHLLRAVDIDPDDPNNHIFLARCFWGQKRLRDALHTLEPLVRNGVEYPDLYNFIGLLLLEQKNYLKAFDQFRHAIKLNSRYKEAYANLGTAILERIRFLQMDPRKEEEITKNLDFLVLLFQKLRKISSSTEKPFVSGILRELRGKNVARAQSLLHDFRQKFYFQKIPPELIGYEFYLILRYLPDRLTRETLKDFEKKFTEILKQYPNYADIWNFLALNHLMLCRDHFLEGWKNFEEATEINPRYQKAQKNLRLVKNDGREFLSLIKAVVK